MRFRLLLLVVVVSSVAACDDARSMLTSATAPTPVATTPTSPSPALDGELINGVVYDSAFRPLAGARVEILDGPQLGTSTVSAGNGEFSLRAVIDDTTRFRATREGHVTATATPQPDCDRCNPRRWIFFYLKVLDAPVDLAGNYTLTFIADNACTNLPHELQTRTYEASVQPRDISYPGFPANSATSFEVVPKGSAFSDGLNLFFLNVAGNYVNVSLGDHTDPGVTERVATNTYFAFGGWAITTVATPVQTISTTFRGWIDYCELSAPIGPRYDCGPAKAIKFSRCDSGKHQLILTRR